MPRVLWTREELVITLSLYFKLPFGKLSPATPEIQELAKLIGRTKNAVNMRLCNYAACDSYITNSGRHGLVNGISVCQPIWDEFYHNREKLNFEAELIRAKYMHVNVEKLLSYNDQVVAQSFLGEDRMSYVKTRVNQNAFRQVILENYEHKCAISGIDVPQLLVASHIVPWAEDVEHRLDPSNGLCLSSLYDKAFDQGLIAIDPNDFSVIISKELKEHSSEEYYHKFFKSIERLPIDLPIEYSPNPDFLQYHIDRFFSQHN